VTVTDRRHLRRAATIEELLDTAIQVMAEQGAGGLSLGEVARRMGVRPPSLYVYFPSKNAVYDAVFAMGWRMLGEEFAAVAAVDKTTDLEQSLQTAADTFVRWCLEHPVHAQLMVWRPVPNWEPSAEAYELAIACFELGRRWLTDLQSHGKLRPEVPVDDLLNAWTALTAGVISQQLANAPHDSFETGAFTRALPALVSMYATHYGKKKR
jgi:AcrR family transcriptional regulator